MSEMTTLGISPPFVFINIHIFSFRSLLNSECRTSVWLLYHKLSAHDAAEMFLIKLRLL